MNAVANIATIAMHIAVVAIFIFLFLVYDLKLSLLRPITAYCGPNVVMLHSIYVNRCHTTVAMVVATAILWIVLAASHDAIRNLKPWLKMKTINHKKNEG